ncbi:MAG: hypothetical protein KBT10_05375 [Bacteroidales bacterium]|nr:hypothetical protein [Candidatus Sodaliphilus aphodohippi]
MKRLLTLTLVVLLDAAMFAQKFPANIYSGLHGDFHVQGIAYDHQRRCVYLSVTTALLKLDLEGNLLASMTGLTGHMGSIGINPDDGRLYGSLEYKHDVIGDNISRHLGIKNDTRTGYYIAVIDLDKFTRLDMTTDEVMTTIYIKEVLDDVNAKVSNNGRELDHRYGVAGFDGVTFAPEWGKRGGRNYLYVAYGMFGDTTRTDNDHQVLLCYDVRDWKKYERPIDATCLHQSGPKKPRAKYFVFTGNTNWGIQNLEYDPHTGNMFAAVYPGAKNQWPRYEMFVLDMHVKPHKAVLRGVEPRTTATMVDLVKTGRQSADGMVWGWEHTQGSKGITSLGDGLFYLSETGVDSATGKNYANLHLYRWDDVTGFTRE